MAVISICIITKNEAQKLKKCLHALEKSGAEIVVTDTGSTDDTVEIARQYTDSVYYFEWCNDFAAARNFAASKAQNDIILMVDTDEYLTCADWKSVYDMLDNHRGEVGRIRRINYFTRGNDGNVYSEYVNRLYDRRLFRYEGAIHEQIVPAEGEAYDTFEVELVFDHWGYEGTPEEIEAKTNRNIVLLTAEYERNPEDAYVLYQLGKSYYMKGDYDSAYEWFAKATAIDLDIRLEYVVDLIISYGYAMINSGRQEEALGMEGLMQDLGDVAEYDFLMGLIYMKNMLFEEAVDMFIEATKKNDCQMEGVNSYKAFYNVGAIYECCGDIEKALEYYRMCGSYSKAIERIELLK